MDVQENESPSLERVDSDNSWKDSQVIQWKAVPVHTYPCKWNPDPQHWLDPDEKIDLLLVQGMEEPDVEETVSKDKLFLISLGALMTLFTYVPSLV